MLKLERKVAKIIKIVKRYKKMIILLKKKDWNFDHFFFLIFKKIENKYAVSSSTIKKKYR